MMFLLLECCLIFMGLGGRGGERWVPDSKRWTPRAQTRVRDVLASPNGRPEGGRPPGCSQTGPATWTPQMDQDESTPLPASLPGTPGLAGLCFPARPGRPCTLFTTAAWNLEALCEATPRFSPAAPLRFAGCWGVRPRVEAGPRPRGWGGLRQGAGRLRGAGGSLSIFLRMAVKFPLSVFLPAPHLLPPWLWGEGSLSGRKNQQEVSAPSGAGGRPQWPVGREAVPALTSFTLFDAE